MDTRRLFIEMKAWRITWMAVAGAMLIFAFSNCETFSSAEMATTTSTTLPTTANIGGGGGSYVPPRLQGWNAFSRDAQELEGAGMYTYILFGREKAPAKSSTDYMLLDKLCREIFDTTYGVRRSTKNDDLRHYNLFCVPMKPLVTEEGPLTSWYDFPLSKAYLAKLASCTQTAHAASVLQSTPGPFLISSLKPLPSVRGENFVLYADLSDLHPDAIGELLRLYKRKITTQRINEDEAFGPVSIRALSLVLKASDDIIIAKVEVPAWIHFGEAKKIGE